MDQPLGSRLLRLSGYMQGSLSVDLVECCAAFLHVVANGIDDRSRLFHRPGNRRFVPYIGMHELDPTVPAKPLEERCAVGVAHSHAHIVPRGGQVFHDLATEES